MASHTLRLRPLASRSQGCPINPMAGRFGTAAPRIDAVALGAAAMAAVMLAALMVLRDEPGSARGCRSRLFRDPVSGLTSGRDGVRPDGDHVECGRRSPPPWTTGRSGRPPLPA